MKWSKPALKELIAHVGRMGLKQCPVCGGELSLAAKPRPVLVPVGGAPWAALPGATRIDVDPDANVLFMLMVLCQLCGHAMFFDTERILSDEYPTLWNGPGEEPDV